MADKRLQRIMAEDERLFRAMQPGQVAKGAAAIRGSDKPSPKKPVKKKSQKRAEKGVSRFDVFSFGVVDAIQRAMAPVNPPVREAIEEVEASSDVKQGQTDASAVQAVSPKTSGSQEGAPSSSVDTKPRESQRDAEPDYSLENPFQELPDEQLVLPSQNQPEYTYHFRDDVPDMEGLIQDSMDRLGLDAGFSDEPDNPFEELDEDGVEDAKPEASPLVQKRRERAESERKAAAKNFKEQQAPILGIPNPVPMQHADQNQGVNAAANPDETALAIDESVNAASELARAMVDLMDKFSTEMTALSVRVRNLELAMDRF